MQGVMRSVWLSALPLLLQLVGLTLVVFYDTYIQPKQRRIMLLIIGVTLSLIAQNIVEFLTAGWIVSTQLRLANSIFGYSVRPLIIVLFFYIMNPGREYRLDWILTAINAAIYLTALFTDICFTIDEENIFQRGPLGYTCHIVSGVLLAHLLFLTIREYYRSRKTAPLIPLFNAVLIATSVVMDSEMYSGKQPIAYLTIATVSGCVFYYIWLHLQFVREHERALMAEQRIQIMMSQIQPHFLYNTLSTIQALCRIDPERAFDTTEKFGAYLRQNIDSLDQPELIPLKKELEHTRIYAEIEMIRFPNIHVEYDIQDADFALPALTIQPMVENAIRHGVRIRREGNVSVLTRMAGEYHEIVISDNGRGFDPQAAEANGEGHIGIRNVRERIERMCGGMLKIDSALDLGTTVTIRIPQAARGGVQ